MIAAMREKTNKSDGWTDGINSGSSVDFGVYFNFGFCCNGSHFSGEIAVGDWRLEKRKRQTGKQIADMIVSSNVLKFIFGWVGLKAVTFSPGLRLSITIPGIISTCGGADFSVSAPAAAAAFSIIFGFQTPPPPVTGSVFSIKNGIIEPLIARLFYTSYAVHDSLGVCLRGWDLH